MDHRAAALGRLRQAAGEAAHVHLAAALVEQAADETIARHLGAHARRMQDLHVGVDAVGHQPLGAARQRFQVGRLCGQLELAAAREVAVDGLVAHDAFHGVDRGVVGVVPGTCTLHADLGRDLGVVDREPVVDVAAIASRGLGRDAFAGLQHRDAGAALGQGQRRRQPGEAAADHGHVHLRRQVARLRAEGRGAVGPVGVELHGVAGFSSRQRPTTPGRPPMSVISV